MYKLNLHLHTRYSDGNNTIEQYATYMKKHGFCCLVTSDHDYMMNLEMYEAQLVESKAISKKLNFPIINAVEISLWNEEAILIGEDACKLWFKARLEGKISAELKVGKLDALKEFLSNNDTLGHRSTLVLVHPHPIPAFGGNFNSEFYKLFVGYEIANSGSYWEGDSLAKLRELMPCRVELAGIDAHGLSFVKDWLIGNCHNLVKMQVTDSRDLVSLLQANYLANRFNIAKDESLYLKAKPKGIKYKLGELKWRLKNYRYKCSNYKYYFNKLKESFYGIFKVSQH